MRVTDTEYDEVPAFASFASDMKRMDAGADFFAPLGADDVWSLSEGSQRA